MIESRLRHFAYQRIDPRAVVKRGYVTETGCSAARISRWVAVHPDNRSYEIRRGFG